jgi:hypothetical protein
MTAGDWADMPWLDHSGQGPTCAPGAQWISPVDDHTVAVCSACGLRLERPEYTIRLTPTEAEVIINGLRGWAHHQQMNDPGCELDIPLQDEDPYPGDLAAVADKVELAMREAAELGGGAA